MMRNVLVAAMALLLVQLLVRAACAQPAAGYAMTIDGLKLGISPEQAEAVLKAHDGSTRIRALRAPAPSGQPGIRVLDAATGGTEPGASAEQTILIFTLRAPARAYEIVRARSFAAAERPSLEEQRAAMLHTYGEPSWPDDFAGSIGMPGAHAYAYVYDHDGRKIDAATRGARDLYVVCGGHGDPSGSGAYLTAAQIAGRRESSVSDLLRVADSYNPACGVSYRYQLIVTPERQVSYEFQELISDEMALADRAWVAEQAHDANARPQPPAQAADTTPAVPPVQARPAPPAAAQCEGGFAADAAMKRRQVAAAGGDAEAAREIGRMYEDGRDVPQDFVAALAWYTRAAVDGEPTAMFAVALMYDDGRGVPVDRAEAARWYRLAADHGSGRAEYNLALLYMHGDGVAPDPAQAGALFRAAATHGIDVPPHLLSLGAAALQPPAVTAAPAAPVAAALPAVPTPPASAAAAPEPTAPPDDQPLVPATDESCGHVLMSEQLEEEITNADRVTLHGCRAAR